MTDRLSQLMHAEAEALDVPHPPVSDIVGAGQRERRRRRVVPVLGAAAAAVVVSSLALVSGPVSAPDRGEGPVAPHERSSATFTAAGTEAARRAYGQGGAFAIGSTVYFGDFAQGVESGATAVRGLYYTSVGVLLRAGEDHSMDGPNPDRYSLIGTDGSVTGLELPIGDVSPSTDPRQPYLAYARPGEEDDWEVVVLDLRSAEPAAVVPVEGTFTWGGWDAPPVALSGDHVYVGLDDATIAVDWHTGDAAATPLPASTYPDINADRYLQVENGAPADGTGLGARVRVREALTGDTLLDLPDVGDRGASLSPGGNRVLVLPYMGIDSDGQIQRLTGAVMYDVSTGESRPVPASTEGGYGWTPDDSVFSLSDRALTLCDMEACSTSPLPEGLRSDEATVRLGGIVNEP